MFVCLSIYLFIYVLGVENSWLEADRPVLLPVRSAVSVRETHLDHQGKGAHSEASVCRLRHRQAAAHRHLHECKLQPPGPTVRHRHLQKSICGTVYMKRSN